MQLNHKGTKIWLVGPRQKICIPSVLEPNFDLFGLNVGEDRALADELLAANGAGFGAVMIEPLEGLNLLRCITDILPVVQS